MKFDNTFGHVDLGFAIEFEMKLGLQWYLADHKGNTHVITYNMDLLNSKYHARVVQIHKIYDFKGNHHILFRYVDICCYHIIVFKGDSRHC